MDDPEPGSGSSKTSPPAISGLSTPKPKLTRSRKRRRISSNSSSDTEPVLPENLLEVEKNLHASAVKNNLDDVSVKKILKKVVTNDHVLALVKLREEEENMAVHPDSPKPKLTRSKAKELRKVSPKTAWNLENLELTPIKHIPVKTRPEVTALIAQELPEDEDDEEYEPTHDDIPSDDDHTLESCSDLDSQPRTPATPRRAASPRIIKDGPFKVPQNVSTPRRKLDLDEDATIAERTRSKLSLSAVPIDHIEGSFVPPDELPMVADDVWTEFLQDCLNPDTEAADDDDDPEYNVAADPDAHDEDEEGLENIIKISKKEINDLMTELFNVMPEGLTDEIGGKLASEPNVEAGRKGKPASRKQERLSNEETQSASIKIPKKRQSIGKSETPSDSECQESGTPNLQGSKTPARPPATSVTLSVLEGSVEASPAPPGTTAPAPLYNLLVSKRTLRVQMEQGAKLLPEQLEIFQQQLRQHIQVSTSNFLQLYVHPIHWALAPTYKEYLETFNKLVIENPKSVANVCNLKLAVELVQSWEKSVSADTPENKEMVEFVHKEIERARRRAAQSNLYVGDFHETFLNTVTNSPVFLYPHLLPSTPYRDGTRKNSYLRCEDELLTLGLDQFWQYVEDNRDLFNIQPVNSVHRPGLVVTVQLVCKHMFPWLQPRSVLNHIRHVRKHIKDNKDNPIVKFFETREVTPVKHMLLPFNPNLTLYEQPENEMPRIWIKHLAKSSKRFMDAMYKRSTFLYRFGQSPAGVPVELGAAVTPPSKPPLPIAFTRQIHTNRPSNLPPTPDKVKQDRFVVELTPLAPSHTPPTSESPPVPPLTPIPTANTTNVMYSIVKTSTGSYLVPLSVVTSTTDSATTPICSSEVAETVTSNLPEESNVPQPGTKFSVTIPMKNTEITPIDHCLCCIKLRSISKIKQTLISDFFKMPTLKTCPCKKKRGIKYPRVTKKLRLLINNYKAKYSLAWNALTSQMITLEKELDKSHGILKPMVPMQYNLDEIAAVTSFQLKLTIRTNVARSIWMKKKIYTIISQFDPDSHDIYPFIKQIEKTLDTEGVDVYKEFMGFLTMEQADKIGSYADYFKQECLTDLMKKIEDTVLSLPRKYAIIKRVYDTLMNHRQKACDICFKILDACDGYPGLAEYVFSLFPHTNPRLDAKDQNKVPIREDSSNTRATYSTRSVTNKVANNMDPGVTDNIDKGSTVPQQNRTVIRATDKDSGISQTCDNINTGSTCPNVTNNIENNTAVKDSGISQTCNNMNNDSTCPNVTNNIENNTTVKDSGISQTCNNMNTDSTCPNATNNIENNTAVKDSGISQTCNNMNTDSTCPNATNNIEKQGENSLVQATDNAENSELQRTTDNLEEQRAIDNDNNGGLQQTTDKDNQTATDNADAETTCNDLHVMDYEADNSASDDDERNESLMIIEDPEELNETQGRFIKTEETLPHNDKETPTLTVPKTEVEDYSESDMSMMIMSEEEHSVIKSETPEWKRDEDKLLLQLLKQSLTPDEMKDKTILEIIEQKKVLSLAAEDLPEKSLDDVRERILYLLEFLVLNEQMISGQ